MLITSPFRVFAMIFICNRLFKKYLNFSTYKWLIRNYQYILYYISSFQKSAFFNHSFRVFLKSEASRRVVSKTWGFIDRQFGANNDLFENGLFPYAVVNNSIEEVISFLSHQSSITNFKSSALSRFLLHTHFFYPSFSTTWLLLWRLFSRMHVDLKNQTIQIS